MATGGNDKKAKRNRLVLCNVVVIVSAYNLPCSASHSSNSHIWAHSSFDVDSFCCDVLHRYPPQEGHTAKLSHTNWFVIIFILPLLIFLLPCDFDAFERIFCVCDIKRHRIPKNCFAIDIDCAKFDRILSKTKRIRIFPFCFFLRTMAHVTWSVIVCASLLLITSQQQLYKLCALCLLSRSTMCLHHNFATKCATDPNRT